MRFDAIVHAPTLRAGARLNIAEADQTEGEAPERIEIGSEIRLKFGVCCPDRFSGVITDYVVEPERAVLAVGTKAWTLLKGDNVGVTTPGLVSETWYVA